MAVAAAVVAAAAAAAAWWRRGGGDSTAAAAQRQRTARRRQVMDGARARVIDGVTATLRRRNARWWRDGDGRPVVFDDIEIFKRLFVGDAAHA